jgi:hypothetical protein
LGKDPIFFHFQLAQRSWQVQTQRFYSSGALTKADIDARVLAVCKAFDKITADKVKIGSNFWFKRYLPTYARYIRKTKLNFDHFR